MKHNWPFHFDTESERKTFVYAIRLHLDERVQLTEYNQGNLFLLKISCNSWGVRLQAEAFEEGWKAYKGHAEGWRR